MSATAAFVTVAGALIGLGLMILVIRAGVAPLRQEMARIAAELELRNEAEYGGEQ